MLSNYREQLPRNALVWLILCQFLLLVPHLTRLPVWVVLVYLVAAVSRVMIFQGRWSFPGRYVKATLTVVCFSGVALNYGTLIGLEPTVALLLVAYALKLMEVSKIRDAYVLIFMGYFVCLTEFLFTQELLATAYMVVTVLINTTALLALHQPGQDRFNLSALRGASVMLLQAFPLMLLLFFVFPRIGPLWSVPLKSHAAKSGISDFMSPGDIADLSLSDDVAFRVQFDGTVPARRELYWRGLVFSRHEDGEWRSLRWREIPENSRRVQRPVLNGDFRDYSIILEPTQQNWLYALPFADTPDRGIITTNNFTLVSPVEVQDQRHYEVRSWLDVPLELELADWRKELETELPENANPRTRELAHSMFVEAGGDPTALAQAVLTMFTEQPYFYTLRPPLLQGEKMDQFLFESRRGFCEHYAAAFAWIMRAAGIPARVVVGYQGGEVNPVNGTVIVHQFDAHAWNEIWLDGRGWVRVDPTAAIAPARIEFGLEEAMQSEGSFLSGSPLSPLRFRDVTWLNLLRLRLDAINYSWQLFVLTYDREQQYQLLGKLLGSASRTELVTGIVILWCALLAPVMIVLLWRRRGVQLDPATRAYREFCSRMRRCGLARQPEEAPSSYADRVCAALPHLAAEVTLITRAYESLAYSNSHAELPEARRLALLKRQVRRFRPGL